MANMGVIEFVPGTLIPARITVINRRTITRTAGGDSVGKRKRDLRQFGGLNALLLFNVRLAFFIGGVYLLEDIFLLLIVVIIAAIERVGAVETLVAIPGTG